jgi:hypothetical protein
MVCICLHLFVSCFIYVSLYLDLDDDDDDDDEDFTPAPTKVKSAPASTPNKPIRTVIKNSSTKPTIQPLPSVPKNEFVDMPKDEQLKTPKVNISNVDVNDNSDVWSEPFPVSSTPSSPSKTDSKNSSKDNSKIESSIKSTPPPPPPPTTPVNIPPPPPKKQGNILTRLFQKSGGNREIDINVVLQLADSAQFIRTAVASLLAQHAPVSMFPELSPEGFMYDKRIISVVNHELSDMELFTNISEENGLTSQQAAEAFADVASAMLVKLVDSAAELVEKKASDAAILNEVDEVVNFVSKAGETFSQCFPGIMIEPVQYNGRAKKGNIETLYYIYFKAVSEYELKQSMKMLMPADETSKTEDSEANTKMEFRAQQTGLLQRALAIKEGKRSSLERKATKELLMSSGGSGNLGDIMGALSGKSPDSIDPKALEDMLSGVGGENLEDPLKGLSQEEALDMTKSYLEEVYPFISSLNSRMCNI